MPLSPTAVAATLLSMPCSTFAAAQAFLNRTDQNSGDPETSGGTPGFYLEFDLPQAQQSVLDKLEYQRSDRIEVVAAHPSAENPDILSATVSFLKVVATITCGRFGPIARKTL